MGSPTKFTVALVQMDTALADVDRNLTKIIDRIADRPPGVDLIVFPELASSGYAVGARHPEASLRLDDERFARLLQATRGVTAAVGFIEETAHVRFFNSLAILSDQTLLGVHRKISLPTYGIFEEGKLFGRGSDYRVFDLGALRIAPFICADAWSPGLAHLAALDDASVFVMSVCSPDGGIDANFSSQDGWKRLCRFYATTYGVYVVFVNRVGREGALRYWGQSEVVDPFGNVVASVPDDRETVITVELDLAVVRRARIAMPGIRDENLALLQRGLARIEARKRGET